MLRALSVLAVPLLVSARMVFPDTPPRGYNSFDSGRTHVLNQTTVLQLAKDLKAQYGDSGYDTLTLDSGWAVYGDNGIPIADPARFSNMTKLAEDMHAIGMKLGLYEIRGVLDTVAASKPFVKGTNYTLDQLIDQNSTGGAANGSCHWAQTFLGINASHPGARAYYQSRIDMLASYNIDFIKCDCMMCSSGGCYYGEMELFSGAVKNVDRDIVLSYSPGGQNHPDDGKWAADNQMCSMYRVTTDFHGGWGGWGGMQQSIFIMGNFSAAHLNGYKNTYPDLDMIPLEEKFWTQDQETADRGQSIATVWMITRSPLMEAGKVPSDNTTLSYMTNSDALAFHGKGESALLKYEGNCTCHGATTGSCSFYTPWVGDSCVTTWVSKLANNSVTETAFAVINMGEVNATIETTFAEVGGPTTSGPHAVKNIWTGEVTQETGSVKTTLRPHESAFYRFQ